MQTASPIRNLAGLASVAFLAAACAAPPVPSRAHARDLPEQLLWEIDRSGFQHRLEVQHERGVEEDRITVRLPADAVLRKHPLVERMLRGVGRIAASQGSPVRLQIRSIDRPSADYLYGLLAEEVAGARNVALTAGTSDPPSLVLTTLHAAPAAKVGP